MVLKFKTYRDGDANRQYLAIDTEVKMYTTLDPDTPNPDPPGNGKALLAGCYSGVEIKARDYKWILSRCISDGYTELTL